MNHIEEFRAAIMAAGLTAPDHIVADGKVHRFASNGNPRSDAGWYWMYDDERPLGKFGCWKHGVEVEWSARVQRQFTPEEKAAWKAKMQESERLRAEAQRLRREQAETAAADMWSRAGDAAGHEYLARKLVGAYGIRELDGELLVPMRAGPGAYVGLQRILPDGQKFFLEGTPSGGAYHVIGKPARDGLVVIAEGYATGASVHEALGCCVVVAFNAGNLEPVAKKIRAAMPAASIVIAADDDRWTEGNPGMKAAAAAAAAVRGTVAVPVWANARATKRTDFNDLHADEGLDAVAACFETPSPGSGRDHAESVPAARAANNPASTEAGATPSPVDSAVDVPPARSTGSHTVGGVASDEDDSDLVRMSARFSERASPMDNPDAPCVFAASPMDTARKFFNALGEMGNIWYWRGDFYRWTGIKYKLTDKERIHHMLYEFFATCVTYKTNPKTGTSEVVAFLANQKHVNDAMHFIRASCLVEFDDAPRWLERHEGDPDPRELMAFRNGVLHVPTRTLLPATPRLFNVNSLPFDYDPSAPEPVEWLKFLGNVWPNEPDVIEAIGDMFGYMLTGDTSQQKMFMLIGPPRSGKGTILRILESIIGTHNRASPSLASLGSNFGLQPLIGKRLAMISDARLSGKADQAPIVENLLRISGEDSLTIDRKNQVQWSGKLSTRFAMAANEIPNFADASGALPSRFIMFKMTKSNRGSEDSGLTARLLRELPGILMWALDGLDRLRERGYLVTPRSGQDLLDEMGDAASPIGMFVGECCVVEDGAEVDRGALYDAWADWCKEMRMDHAGTMTGFARRLTAAVSTITRSQPRDGFGGRREFYKGIRLRHPHESPV